MYRTSAKLKEALVVKSAKLIMKFCARGAEIVYIFLAEPKGLNKTIDKSEPEGNPELLKFCKTIDC